LESGAASILAGAAPTPRLDPERFWALKGLQERIGTGSAVLFTGSVTIAAAGGWGFQIVKSQQELT
jgi:hypothetical protein